MEKKTVVKMWKWGILLFLLNAEILPKEELIPGLKGEALTVIANEEIVSFEVEVLDILPGMAPGGGALILFRSSGKAIEKAGGIAGGMSGSPIYLKGKLAGAISVGFDFADPFIGGATYIGDMLASREESYTETPWFGSLPETTEAFSSPSVSSSSRWKIPLVIGIPRQTAVGNFVSRWIAQRYPNVMVLPGGAEPELPLSFAAMPLKPGDALAVVLGSGFIPIYAFGTVTDVEENGRFLAFGHSMFEWGRVHLPVASVYVSTTVKSVEAPFKIGKLKYLIGTLTRDEGPAVSGWLGKIPKTVSLEISIKDLETEREMNAVEELAPFADWFVPLSVATVALGLERTAQRISPATVFYSFTLVGEGIPPIQWKDVVNTRHQAPRFLPASIAAEFPPVGVADRLAELLHLLLYNPFHPVKPTKIHWKAEIGPEDRLYYVQSLQLLEKEGQKEPFRIHPGETLSIRTNLQPHRKPAREEVLTLSVPSSVSPGKGYIVIYGGSKLLQPFAGLKEIKAADLVASYHSEVLSLRVIRSLEDAIEIWKSQERNDQLWVRLIMQNEQAEQEPLSLSPQDIATNILLDGVVVGFKALEVEIVGPEIPERLTAPEHRFFFP